MVLIYVLMPPLHVDCRKRSIRGEGTRRNKRAHSLKRSEVITITFPPGYCSVCFLSPQDLEQMQAMLDAEFGRDSDDGCGGAGAGEDSNSSTPPDELFCPACNKLFKSSKA